MTTKSIPPVEHIDVLIVGAGLSGIIDGFIEEGIRLKSGRTLPADIIQPPKPLLSFTSGYVLRSLDQFPKQSGKAPWKLRQNYLVDLLNLRLRAIDDGTLVLSD